MDFSDVTKNDITTEDIRKIAAQDVSAVETMEHIVAAIVAPTDLTFGLSLMWAAYADNADITTAVFKELGAAQEWVTYMRKKLT